MSFWAWSSCTRAVSTDCRVCSSELCAAWSEAELLSTRVRSDRVLIRATAGGFSPISVFGSIVNGVVNDLAENATLLFGSSFVFNLLLSVVVFFLFGGRELLGRRQAVPGDDESEDRFQRRVEEKGAAGERPMAGGTAVDAAEVPELDRDKILTLVGIVSLVAVALAFDVDVGFVALSIAAILSLISPQATKGAVNKVAWPTVLLICGIVMYVGLLETLGTIDWLGEQVATIDSTLLAALLIPPTWAASSPPSPRPPASSAR